MRNSLHAAYLRTMLDLAAERGIDPGDVLAGSRLTVDVLESPDLRVRARDAAHIMQRVVEMSGDPGLGLEFGLRTNPTAHGYLGYAAMCSRTLCEALELTIRYVHLRQCDVGLQLLVDGDQAVLEARDTHALGTWRHLIHESIMVGFWRMVRFMLDESSMPYLLWFDWPEPAYYASFRSRIPHVRFSMPAIQLRIPREYLARRLITADQHAMRLAVMQIEREAATSSATKTQLLERIRRELAASDTGYPSLEQVASRLFMSSRTLKRKLNEHGTSFRVLLDETRYRNAKRMLADPDVEIQQVAMALGYRDPPSFTRAYRRWSGDNPSAARRALLDRSRPTGSRHE